MRVGAAALSGGIFGVIGTLCFFLAFGTDYWLVASDNCGPYRWQTQTTPMGDKDANRTETLLVEEASTSPPSLTLHHEGFFWRCAFQVEPTTHAVLATLFTNQPESKVCIHGYLFPLPVAVGQVPHPNYDPTAACLFLFTLLLYVLWMEVVDVKSYILQERGETCPNAEVSVLYGLSFMVAAAGVPLELISGLVFLLVGRAIHASK
ncbi:transmembrane protein 182-like isoform X2 [Pundamilia nyererei]|uniref:Transmembrane protein 182-like isoform X2 n=1 Tax=Pundamilia nyererei TaxID=303518 RepID=A0A9Y3QSF5_9CICH|nr:PREDICTED: transmembrane protein 182-like isoform X2 [Pundamilia nyererei]